MRFMYLFVSLAVLAAGNAAGLEYFVSTTGNDANPGTREQPFATIEAARDALRAMRAPDQPRENTTIWISGGDYVRTAAFLLTAADGGTREAPVEYRAVAGEQVRFLGGHAATGFVPLAESPLAARIPESARPNIVQADLAALGITDYGTLRARGFGRPVQPAALELFFNGRPMTLARWPNNDWAKIGEVPENSEGMFHFIEDRPGTWAQPDQVWIHGYWTWPWAESHEHVASIDAATKTLTTQPPHGVYGYKEGRRYYAYNILEELDQPGEWYVDGGSGVLFFWPPEPLEGAEVSVSLLEAPMVIVEGASFVTFRGITFTCSRDSGVLIHGGAGNLIAGCTFSNLGTQAVSIDPRTRDDGSAEQPIWNGVRSCNLYNLGEGGIYLNGGDRASLSPGANFAENNDLWNYSRFVRTYRPAIMIGGVRNRAAHNHIHDAPHMAIGYGGNDHILEFNHIHHVCMETSDAGATYIGRDWTARGNIVRFNFFHDLGKGDVQAVYLDDWASGTIVFGNVCHKAGRAVLVGGGRDNVIENNIFIDCSPAVHIDQRGLGWAKGYFDGTTNTLYERFDAVNAAAPPYSLRYPPLATIREDEPAHAKYNHVVRNVRVGGHWLNLADGLEEGEIDLADNWTEGDPGFVDPDRLNFQLRENSPVYALGFERIPFERIGTYEDADRAALAPVR